MAKKKGDKVDPLESYWLPKFEESARLDDDSARNLGHTFGHSERRIVFEELLEIYLPGDAKSVLDVGCGTGTYFDLYEKMNLSIYGIDYSSSQIEVAKKRYPEANLIACLVGDSPDSIKADLAVSIGVTQVVSDLEPFLNDISKRISNDGIAIISCLNRGSIWPGGLLDPHLRFFRRKEMQAYLSQDFEIIHCRRFYPMPGIFSLIRPLLYKLQVPLLNHGLMFVLKKK